MSIERLEEITNKTDQNLVILLQDLIRIPSWVGTDVNGTKHNENDVVEYLEKWLIKNTNLSVTKQKLDGGRYNLIATKGNPDIVFLGHTDTVALSEGAPYDQLAAEIHDGKIWGRGSTDMKSGLATMAQALALSPETNNVWAFFYADEEYDFLGMKSLIRDYAEIRPKIIVSSDGSNLEIGHGCRGLIEFRGVVRGITGHPAIGNGVNAIDGIFKGMSALRTYLDKFNHPIMGKTSLNLAYLLGGQEKEDSFNKKGHLNQVGQEGNVIPDIAEFVVDIRPSSPNLTVENILDTLKKEIESTGCSFKNAVVRHNLGAWYTDLSEIESFVDLAKSAIKKDRAKTSKPGKSGYLDLQMLWEATGRPKAFMFGGGSENTAHKPNEHVDIESLIKERDFFKKILENH